MIALSCQLKYLQSIVVQARDLTLEWSAFILASDLNGCLAVEDSQLPPCGGPKEEGKEEGERMREEKEEERQNSSKTEKKETLA